jgi:hypothetical protein
MIGHRGVGLQSCIQLNFFLDVIPGERHSRALS